MTLTPDVVTVSVKCQQCGSYAARLECRQCQKKVCNLHFCDVCRHCTKHCICWTVPQTVYHPPHGG